MLENRIKITLVVVLISFLIALIKYPTTASESRKDLFLAHSLSGSSSFQHGYIVSAVRKQVDMSAVTQGTSSFVFSSDPGLLGWFPQHLRIVFPYWLPPLRYFVS